MLKRIALFAALFAIALALQIMALPTSTARAQNPSPTPAPTATPAIMDAGSGGTQLVYWNGLTGGDGAVMNAMVQAFVKANPDISVHTESYLWDIMFPKLTASFVAGEPPDVFVLHASEIPQFAELGILRESDDMFDTNGGPIPAKDVAGIDSTMYKGKHYGVVFDNHGFGTWVNLNLFKAAGVPEDTAAPKNADEFIKLATKLTLDANGKHPDEAGFDAKNVKQWGTGIDWTRVHFESLLPQFGGSLISADGKTATINNEAGVATLQAMYDMVYKYHIAPDPTTTNGFNAFQAGTIAIMPTGTWFRDVLVKQHPEIKYTAWPMVQLGSKPGTWVSAHVLFIASSLQDDKKLAAAKKFIQYLSDNGATWADAGHVPARISVQSKLDAKTYISNVVFGKSFQDFGVFVDPQNPNVSELTNAYDPEITAAMSGQKSVKQALDDAAKRMQAVLDRTK